MGPIKILIQMLQPGSLFTSLIPLFTSIFYLVHFHGFNQQLILLIKTIQSVTTIDSMEAKKSDIQLLYQIRYLTLISVHKAPKEITKISKNIHEREIKQKVTHSHSNTTALNEERGCNLNEY